MPIGLDILNNNLTYDVSIVSASMNRHTAILSSLHNWLFFPVKEIIIVDWCSYTVLDDIIPSYLKDLEEYKKKVKIYRVDGLSKWVLTWAFNLGFSLASSEYILKLDAEVVFTHPCFFEINKFGPNLLIRGDWEKSPSKYLNGSFLCKKEHLEKIGYFNERIVTYGWDDSDLYYRLAILGLEENIISFLDHIDHSDHMRTFYSKKKTICLKTEIYKNRILSLEQPSLRYDEDRYERIDEKKFKIVKIDTDLVNLDIQITNDYTEQFDNFKANLNYVKPCIFTEDKFVVLKVFNGFGNRLRALLSTLEFTEFFRYKLYVIWEITAGFDNSHFEEFFQHTDSLKVTFVSSDKLESIDNFDIKIYNEITDNQVLTVFDPSYKKIYIELSNYITGIFDFKNTFVLTCSYFKYLMPSKHIEEIVNYITEKIIGGKYNIFHIRRGDAVSGKFKHNYSVSSIYLFARYINMSDEINVLLSDDYDYCKKFLDVLCPGKFIIINKTNLNKNKNMYEPKYGINMDIVDFFLFRDAKKIYGTNWSSFSYVATHVFGNFNKYIIVNDPNKFGLLKYDKSSNIGDITQSRAVEQYLPFVSTYVDRDSLANYNEEKINLIMAGWFLHTRDCYTKEDDKLIYCKCDSSPENICWPPSEKIDPLFMSFNISNNNVISSVKNISYLKSHSPIGCRDLSTYKKLQNLNIDSYFSYCITLLMKYDNIVKIKKQAICVDVPLDKIDSDIKENYNVVYIKNTLTEEEMEMTVEEKFAICDNIRNKVISSELVITSRLHILTLCLANSVPVKFVGNEYNSNKDACYYSKNRYEGITDLIDNPEKISLVQKQIEFNIISSIYNKYYKHLNI